METPKTKRIKIRAVKPFLIMDQDDVRRGDKVIITIVGKVVSVKDEGATLLGFERILEVKSETAILKDIDRPAPEEEPIIDAINEKKRKVKPISIF
jgi:hypothetical protein